MTRQQAKEKIKSAGESSAMRWFALLVPVIIALISMRQSNHAEESSQVTANSVVGVVKANSRDVQYHLAQGREITRLKQRVAYLEALVGRRGATRVVSRGEDVPDEPPAAKPVTLGGVLRGIGHFFTGG